jgi:hypothetical protein
MNRRQLVQRIVGVGLIAGSAAMAGGCNPYDVGGAQASYGTETVVSTSDLPISVNVVDWRDGSILWSYEVPVGRKLVIDFDQDHYKDNPNRPDRLRWQEMSPDQRYGSLNNEMAVPRTSRVDKVLRAPGEAAPGAKPKAAADNAGER